MNIFFAFVEIFGYGFAAYIFFHKKELLVVYLPVLIFIQNVITPILPSLIYYSTIFFLILYLIDKNIRFFRENIFSLILIIYYGILTIDAKDLVLIRSALFPVIWFFLSIPLISSIYKKHSREEVFKELSISCFIILTIFSLNVILSTFSGYAPNAMYGITSGILYGNLYATDFNILGVAVFILMLSIIDKKDLVFLVVILISLCFIMLSLRRSVMGVSILGVAVTLLLLMSQYKIQKVFAYCSIALFLFFIVILNTNFMTIFIERYEHRNLEDRALEGESRFLEYELLYKDMFIYQDYNPWVGYELFNSGGNYGKGIFGTRTLHSDVTNIAHSSGIIGVLFYILLIIIGFRKVCLKANNRNEKLLILYCIVVFVVYTITGRYTNVSTNILLFLLLTLPLTKNEESMHKLSVSIKALEKKPQYF